jgi:hypothetical protein
MKGIFEGLYTFLLKGRNVFSHIHNVMKLATWVMGVMENAIATYPFKGDKTDDKPKIENQ